MHSVFFALLVLFRGCSASYMTYYAEDYCKNSTGEMTINVEPLRSGSAAFLQGRRRGRNHSDQLCTLVLNSPKGYGVNIAINQLDFPKNLPPNDCENYIQVFDIASKEPNTVCAESFLMRSPLFSSSNGKVYILYRTVRSLEDHTTKDAIDFQLIFTAYAEEGKQVGDSGDTYMCLNGQHIWRELLCDGYTNCGDGTDEGMRVCGNPAERGDWIMGIVLLVIFGGLTNTAFGLSLLCFIKYMYCLKPTPPVPQGGGEVLTVPMELVILPQGTQQKESSSTQMP